MIRKEKKKSSSYQCSIKCYQTLPQYKIFELQYIWISSQKKNDYEVSYQFFNTHRPDLQIRFCSIPKFPAPQIKQMSKTLVLIPTVLRTTEV